MPTPDPPQTGVSTREAAAFLNTSVSDVLRRIARGELRAEKFERKGGTYFRVYLDPPPVAPEPHQPIESIPAPEPHQDVPAIVEAALAPLSAALAAERAEKARLATERSEWQTRAVAAETDVKHLSARVSDLERMTQSQTRQLEIQAEAIAAKDEAIREQATAIDAARMKGRPWWQRLFG